MTRRRTARPLLALALIALALAARPAPAGVELGPAALEPPSTGGLAVVERALAKLSTHRRLLVVAAHPDDEDTSLIALVARGLGGEAAYLSLSRGEGGQNLIGPELGVGLGLIRSRELLAAREIDGGRQFFTRAFDFGYTRSLEETLRLWPREVLIEDAVRVIRRFKPQVVVSVFPGQPHPNHGQHQAAGVTAYEAFRLAGDPAALPQLAAEGLAPWQPQALYRSTWFDRGATTAVLATGKLDPLSGRSIHQIAMASRSMHRSQDMGRLQELGPRETRVGWVQGAGDGGAELFAGIDTSLPAIASGLADPERRRHAAEHLDAAQVLAERTREGLNPARLGASVPALAEIVKHLAALDAFLADGGGRPEERPVADLVREKLDVARTALAAAAGVAVEAAAERATVTPGESLAVQTFVWNSGGEAIESASVELVAAPEWGAAGPVAAGEARPVGAGELATWELAAPVPAGAPPTLPYFLRRPLTGGLYDWSGTVPEVRGEPFGPPPLTARFTFRLAGVPVELEREVVQRYGDQARGEVRRPLRVVPAVEVAVSAGSAVSGDHLVWPLARREPQRLEVVVTSRTKEPVQGRLEVTVTPAWGEIPPRELALGGEGQEQAVEVALQPPQGLAPGRYRIGLAAVLADGRRFDLAVPVLDYEHIRPTPRPEPAVVEMTVADVRLPPLSRVGYVRGASDLVPEYLLQVGVPLELLSAADLVNGGDLARFDAIVVGSRAYETEPALARANGRLLDYARRGGLLIVQYQQYPFVEGKFAPFPLEIARPHDRVTDEAAPVRPLAPDHPVFTTPNRIGAEDWAGWVQERGLYFPHTWDPAYVPLLAMADPGGPEQQGALLVAKLGDGHYVYTGLAFFRQLPAGVPGAYRLFANLLGLGG